MKIAKWIGLVLLIYITIVITALLAQAQTGRISYYGHGRVACSGFHYGPMTAASKTFPCGAHVRVATSRGSASLTITDRGPFVRGRILDVSQDAARVLGLVGPGVLPATVTNIGGK